LPDHETRQAVIFDLDGIILDSEDIWEGVMRELFAAYHLPWSDLDQDDFMGGDNSRQWAAYLHRVSGVPLPEDQIVDQVVRRLLDHYADALPLVPGAHEAVARLAAEYRLGLASSSPREVIAFVLAHSGLDRFFVSWASSDDVARGKPHPDVYRKACELVGAEPSRCAAVEDSAAGIRAAHAAGLKVIAIPRPSLPLDPVAAGLADVILSSVDRLSVDTVRAVLRS